ncbi:MAG: hypothetical protein U0Q18_15495 [Bryobacteraceae bacterium]
MIDLSYCPDRYVRLMDSAQRRLIFQYLDSIPSLAPGADASGGNLRKFLQGAEAKLFVVSSEYNPDGAAAFTCLNVKIDRDYYRLQINGVDRRVIRAETLAEKAATAQMLADLDLYERTRADAQQAPPPTPPAGDGGYSYGLCPQMPPASPYEQTPGSVVNPYAQTPAGSQYMKSAH